MPMERERFTLETTIRGEEIERIYQKELRPVPPEEWEVLSDEEKQLAKPYAFDQRTYEAAPGIVCEQDVAVKMRDGIILYCDVFRPQDSDAKVPAILAWSNYGKRPNDFRTGEDVGYTPGVPFGAVSPSAKFEAADPLFWCPNGYAVVNVDPRGIGYSEGLHDQFCEEEGRDGYDFIEWAAEQEWCNGRCALSGNSCVAMTQWRIASQQPPHLACFAPWEGTSDLYRESLYEGGIPATSFVGMVNKEAVGLKPSTTRPQRTRRNTPLRTAITGRTKNPSGKISRSRFTLPPAGTISTSAARSTGSARSNPRRNGCACTGTSSGRIPTASESPGFGKLLRPLSEAGEKRLGADSKGAD